MSSFQVPFYSEKAISEIVTLSFFSQLFFWNFLHFFGHIFLHAFSQWLFKYVPDQSYIFHQWVQIKCRFTAKKRFQKLLHLVFFRNFFFEIFWIFLVIFFFIPFHSDYSSMFQTNHIFLINEFISSAVLQRKSDFRNCYT